ncbi:MAG: alpha/beta fold hydrolase [Acidimicrobiia bacterium]|nr:alpha/beta fold hydrolase [Acidimicrobiia bacterium]
MPTPLSFTRHPAPGPGAPLDDARGRPRVVLVHSLALDRHVWDGVVPRLTDKAEVLTYDCRGHGQSDRTAGRYTAESFADDLAQLLDHVGWDSAAVAGCSMGGCVALAFAGLHPDRATALGLIDTTAWYGEDAPQAFRKRAEAAREKGMRGLVDFQVTRWFSDAYRERNPPEMQRAVATFVANDFECYAATTALLGDADARKYLPSLRMPVAIVVGEEDYATPVAMAQYLHEQLPQSSLTVLPKARHLTPIEHPEAVAAAIARIL